MIIKRSRNTQLRQSHKATAAWTAFAIYLVAGLFSVRAFAEEADTYQYLDINGLQSILDEK